MFLYAPQFFSSFREWDYGLFNWLSILFQELFLVGVVLTLFGWVLPYTLKRLISESRSELLLPPEFMDITLCPLLIYLLINFPCNLFLLFVNISESNRTFTLIGHGIIAIILAAIWLYKILVPKYVECKIKAVWVISCYFLLAVLIPVIIMINYDFIWDVLFAPEVTFM
jgi:hypothetical protein